MVQDKSFDNRFDNFIFGYRLCHLLLWQGDLALADKGKAVNLDFFLYCYLITKVLYFLGDFS